MNDILSPLLCRHRKSFSLKLTEVSLIEKSKIGLDRNGYTGAILMDYLKVFDKLTLELTITELHRYDMG